MPDNDIVGSGNVNAYFGPALTAGREVNLTAGAILRYFIDNSHAHVGANLTGFLDTVEGCREFEVGQIVEAP